MMGIKDCVVILISFGTNVVLLFDCEDSNKNVTNIAQLVLLLLCLLMGTSLEAGHILGRDVTRKYGWKVRLNAQPGYIYHALLTYCLLVQSFRSLDDFWSGVNILMMVLMMSSLVIVCNVNMPRPLATLPPPMDLWSPAHLSLVFIGMCFMSNCQTGTVTWCSFFLLILASQFLFMCVIRMVLRQMPRCFTIGEVMITSQAFVLFLFSTMTEVCYRLKITSVGVFHVNDISYFSKIILISAGLVCLVPCFLPFLRETCHLVTVIAVTGVSVTIPLLWMGLRQNPLIWFLKYILAMKKLALLGYWLLCTLVAVTIVMVHNNSKRSKQSKVSTAVRKYFHIVAIAIYIPGIYVDPELLRLGSCVALAIFLFLECVRILRIPPLGQLLDEAFNIFLDNQDQGSVILTHIYLLVGCSMPLWLYPEKLEFTDGPPLSLFSGVISLGVGDTAASVIGSKYGRLHWPGSRKTLEGTLAAILSQVFFCWILSAYGATPKFTSFIPSIVIAIILTSFLEAFTCQIDNLILPLFMYTCLQAMCLPRVTTPIFTAADLDML